MTLVTEYIRKYYHAYLADAPVHYAHLCQVQLIPHLNSKSFYSLLFLILSLLQKYVFGSTPISIMCEALLLQYGINQGETFI